MFFIDLDLEMNLRSKGLKKIKHHKGNKGPDFREYKNFKRSRKE